MNTYTYATESIPQINPCNNLAKINRILFIFEFLQTANVCMHMQIPPKPIVKPVKNPHINELSLQIEAYAPEDISSIDEIIREEILGLVKVEISSLIIEKNTVKPHISNIAFVESWIEVDKEVRIGEPLLIS